MTGWREAAIAVSPHSAGERAKGRERFCGWAVDTSCLIGFDPVGVAVGQIDWAAIAR